MKRRSIKFEINFTNKWLYTFVFFGIILVISIGVFAYNSGKPPSVMGHSGDEIMVSFNGQEVSLNDALDSLSSRFLDLIDSGDKKCELVFSSGVSEYFTDDVAYKKVKLPDKCFSLEGCRIIREVFDNNRLLQRSETIFSQNEEGYFSTSLFSGIVNKNGDSNYGYILNSHGYDDSIALIDDLSNVDTSKEYILARDFNAYSGQRIYIC